MYHRPQQRLAIYACIVVTFYFMGFFFFFDSRPTKTYDFNIFFIESMKDHKNFDDKQLCAIESAALWNPNAHIRIYTRNAAIDVEKILERYTNIEMVNFDYDTLYQGSLLEEWWRNAGKIVMKSKYGYSHATDLMRYYLLWKYGGVYIDLDTITVRSLKDIMGTPGMGRIFERNEESLNGAILIVPEKEDPLMENSIVEYKETYDPEDWDWNGPELLIRVLKRMCQTDDIYNALTVDPDDEKILREFGLYTESMKELLEKKRARKCNAVLYPKESFYPITWETPQLLFAANSTLPISLFNKAIVIHFFNKLSKEYTFTGNQNNIYEYFAKFNCPVTFSKVRFENYLSKKTMSN